MRINKIYPAPNSPKTAVKSAANFEMRMVSSILAIFSGDFKVFRAPRRVSQGSRHAASVPNGGNGISYWYIEIYLEYRTVVNADDFLAGLRTFQNAVAINATHVSRTDVEPLQNGREINLLVNIADVAAIIRGFQGQIYNENQGGPDLATCSQPPEM